MNFASCETCCSSLHREIESLTLRLEQVSKGEMKFTVKSKDKINSFKRPYKKHSFVNENEDGKPHTHNVRCHYCGRLGHTTPYCHIMRVEVSKGVMMWVPKNDDCLKKPKVSTSVENLKAPN